MMGCTNQGVSGHIFPPTCEQIWTTLVDWVHEHGGTVHPSMKLRGEGPERGVFATREIERGECLIRLPPNCAISGSRLPPPPQKVYNETGCSDNKKTNPDSLVSSWLKCVAAFYHAESVSWGTVDDSSSTAERSSSWQAYFNSLPRAYETLFQWTDSQVEEFLSGTTLGVMVRADREEQTMRRRYQHSIRPYLIRRGLLDPEQKTHGISSEEVSEEEFQRFLRVCMCISTRGFHLSSSSPNDDNLADPGQTNIRSKPQESDSEIENQNESRDLQDHYRSYKGPFLLPVIDLLNHDPSRKCTTLRRDYLDESTSKLDAISAAGGDGSFWMVAERAIEKEEEIFHSYGDSLTGAQLLQTFGFVPASKWHDGKQTIKIQNQPFCTPACLDKKRHLIAACKAVKSSDTMAGEIRKAMGASSAAEMDTEQQDEAWPIADLPNRFLEEEIPNNDWLISFQTNENDTNSSILTDELITFLVLQFLPEDAYQEICPENKLSAWLDQSILEDYYLGKLVCAALQKAIQMKQADYVPITLSTDISKSSHGHLVGQLATPSVEEEPLQRDIGVLHKLSQNTVFSKDLASMRAMFGLRIRIEELTCLAELSKEVHRVNNCLDRGDSLDSSFVIEPSSKRVKLDQERG